MQAVEVDSTGALQGLDLAAVDCGLVDGAPQVDPFEDAVPDKDARLRAAVSPEEWADRYGAGWNWRECGYLAEVEHLQRAFTLSEQVQIWLSSLVQSRIGEHLEGRYPVLEKLRHSAFHFGAVCARYSDVVAGLRGLCALSWPGFELRLAYVSKYRSDGYAENVRGGASPWVDNDFGLLVYRGGEHALTVGFGVGARGAYVSQVQLRKKRGNRWLFGLGQHYLDAALGVVSAAFGGRVWLVEGRSAAAAVRRSYGKNPCALTLEDLDRIAAVYDRPLADFERTDEVEQYVGRTYVRLAPKVTA